MGSASVEKWAVSRLATLKRLEDNGLADVLAASRDLWDRGLKPAAIRIRRAYYRHDDPMSVKDERRGLPHDLQPPAARLITPKGVALKLHLMMIFATQCQVAPMGKYRPIPLDGDGGLSWRRLVTAPSTSGTGARSNTADANKRRQLTRALDALAPDAPGEKRLVDLPGQAKSASRYENIQLLKEDGSSNAAETVHHRVPGAKRDYIEVPVAFFTQGWVQVLTSTEIVAYLMWLDVSAFPLHDEPYYSGVERAGHFGLNRDAYETHNPLGAFHLVNVERPEGRHDDGKYEGYGSGASAESGRPPCHRITPNIAGLDRAALPVVRKAVTLYRSIGSWDPLLQDLLAQSQTKLISEGTRK
ncbi:hypothetical protein [Kitasatospora sp. NPDC059599]|uniref:hypothetical protein n=1 Tax=Kitasatospora sp. NPDC059599 TaxID=3346880 RepID=UPI00369BBDE8